MSPQSVILLPGGVLPAEFAYPGLVSALGDDVKALPKELEVYAGDRPPAGYSLDAEVEGILRVADEAGIERFNLFGYSGGGASSLAFAARYPERLASLALFEPAWAGNEGLSEEERALWREFHGAMVLPDYEFMSAFVRLQLAADLVPPPPPPGPPPPWMAKRPAGLRAFLKAFEAYELDVEVLRGFTQPVYYGVGGRSNPGYYLRQGQRLAAILPDFTIEVYEERHHFDPPHRAEPERVAAALRYLWGLAPTS